MGVGNFFNKGNKGSNFNFQKRFLQALDICCGESPSLSCPPLCAPPSGSIVGISNDTSPGNGWYLDANLSQLLLLENENFVDSAPCSSGRADFYPPDNRSGPYIFDGVNWVAIEYFIPSWNFGIDITVSGTIPVGWTCQVETSFDAGISWNSLGPLMTRNDLLANPTFPIASTSFRSRLKIYETETCFYYSTVHIETE